MKTIISHATCLAVFLALSLSVSVPVQAQDRDRQCLVDLADAYVDALVAHDPEQVALSADVRMMENLSRIESGEGLWQTATEAEHMVVRNLSQNSLNYLQVPRQPLVSPVEEQLDTNFFEYITRIANRRV